MSLVPRPPDPVAFAPFGAFIDPPEEFGERAFFSDRLAPVPSRVQQCHVNRVARTALPLSLNLVECHPHAAQVFIPMGEVSRYLVVVMPSSSAGGPDITGAEAFIVPGAKGVSYAPGTWHTGIIALDADASFAVFMWRGGEDDDLFVSIPPLEIADLELGSPPLSDA